MIVRPPLVVMHGIWSSRKEAFGVFETEMPKLLQGIEIFGTSYDNSTYFSNNWWVVSSQIVNARQTFAAQGIVARQADVFAHSMGGLLSRIWAGDTRRLRADNHGAGDIHKLVTIDSPHYGAFVANYRDQIYDSCPQSIDLLEWIMRKAGKPINRGAVEDLRSYSGPILHMNMTPIDLPSHVIAGDPPSANYANQIVAYLSIIGEYLDELPYVQHIKLAFCIQELPPIVVPGANDLLVSVNSQLGGLQAQSVFEHEHAGAANRADVILRSVQLLNSNVASRAFARFLITVPPREGGAGLSAQASQASIAHSFPLQSPGDPTMIFVTPSADTIVRPGQLVDVSVDTTPSTTLETLIVATRGSVRVRTNAPFAVQLRVPTNAVGPLDIAALARDSQGRLLTNAIQVQVQPASTIASLEMSPPVHYFILPGTTLQLSVHALYGDGVTRDVTAAGAGTTYTSTDPGIATVTADGLVVPQSSGETVVTANNGASASARIVVNPLPSADLGIRVDQIPSEASPGMPATVRLSLTNAGPSPATSVVIRAALPAAAQIIGGPGSAVCQRTENGHFCVFDSLASGASLSVEFALVFDTPGDYPMQWSIGATSFDPRPDDNAADISLHVNPASRPEVSLDHPEALEQPALDWRTGTSPWFGQTTVTHDGVDAAQSGVIGHSQQSWLEVTNVMATDGMVSFWWKVSSESGYDFLRFYLNGTEQTGSISGDVNWQPKSLPLAPGTNVLRWAYTKDGSGSGATDAAWLDELQIVSYPDPLTDTDGDTLPDMWEARYFGSLEQLGTSDYDRDGINNLDEYLDGTDPTDSMSFFARLTVSIIGQGTVQRSPNLAKYTNGQTVTLTAIPNPANIFVGWSGSLGGGVNPTTLVMDGNKTVTATFTNFIVLGEAVEQPSLTWLSGGDALWFRETNTTHDGVDAAQSGPITDNRSNWMQTTLSGPGVLSFWWKVSSESGYDFLRFHLNGVEQTGRISGNVTWQQKAFSLPAGTNTLRWTYTKDSSASVGADAGWVDEVQFLADADNDGLPDAWESQYFGSLAQPGEGDYDHDGVSNLDEYLDGTDPSSSTSFYPHLTVNIVGLGRVVRSPDLPRYTNGQTVTITAYPDVGHSFLGWSGSITASTDIVSLVMNGNKTMTASFTSFARLGEAVDQPALIWRSGEPYHFWFYQTNITHDGVDAARSGIIDDYQDCWMETTLNGPGVLSFWWKVSSEDQYDYLFFVLDGFRLTGISGEMGWESRSVNVGIGQHVARWQYVKDGNTSMGQDAGWLDQVSWNSFRILAPALQIDGSFRLMLTGVPNTTCTIEVSSDLITWGTLSTLSITQPVTTFVDSAATNNTQRFYRVITPASQ